MRIEELTSDLAMVPSDHKKNLEMLLAVLNPIEGYYIDLGGEPWIPTSGYRFIGEHVRIYHEKNLKRKQEKKKLLAIPMNSQHLKGNAVDIYDPKQEIKFFIAKNLELFEDADIYFEAFSHSQDYVHMQRVAPRSGNRFFLPY